MRKLKPLKDIVVNPSGFDSLANYCGKIPEEQWLCVLTRNRDSDELTESNFECALIELGDESETVQVFRFGHWACGYWEALAIVKGSGAEKTAQGIVDRLNDYPVLNENDFSEREMNRANEIWAECYNMVERIEYIKKNRNQFDFHGFKDLMAVVRGEYFNGYASELLN